MAATIKEIAKKEQIVIDEENVRRKAKDELEKFLATLPKKETKKIAKDYLFNNILVNLKNEELIEAVWTKIKDITTKTSAEAVV